MENPTIDIGHLKSWIGKTEQSSEILDPSPIEAMAATLDRETTSENLPPLWQWIYFLPKARASLLGGDGHEKTGNFLPPIPLSRRMWAGGQFKFIAPLRIGDKVTKTSRIKSVTLKEGRQGSLIFVDVESLYATHGSVAIEETLQIVYRNPAPLTTRPDASSAKERPYDWNLKVTPTSTLLFRYSALTFNGHRIHYDKPYAQDVEGYPGLVVHGPLIATLLLELIHLNLPEAAVTSFECRARRPLFDRDDFEVRGKQDGQTIRLWAINNEGDIAMEATAEIAD